MFRIGGIGCDLKSRKQLGRITSLIVVSTQHLRRIIFAKAARTADTSQLPICVDRAIDQTDQVAFVDICAVQHFRKGAVSGIQVGSHSITPRFK